MSIDKSPQSEKSMISEIVYHFAIFCAIFMPWYVLAQNTALAAPLIDHIKCLPHVLGCLKVRLGRRHYRKWLFGLSEHNERLVILVGSCATVIESMQRIQRGTSII